MSDIEMLSVQIATLKTSINKWNDIPYKFDDSSISSKEE